MNLDYHQQQHKLLIRACICRIEQLNDWIMSGKENGGKPMMLQSWINQRNVLNDSLGFLLGDK
ncbi:hypothetical protein LCGC14_0249970 [marine sediment metagenome]|uniref:Uncharacterized protein n=1 Tax=marine sediment metagenome TaxID=412755 RepID=A0A0F9U9X8_9ZZZZ